MCGWVVQRKRKRKLRSSCETSAGETFAQLWNLTPGADRKSCAPGRLFVRCPPRGPHHVARSAHNRYLALGDRRPRPLYNNAYANCLRAPVPRQRSRPCQAYRADVCRRPLWLTPFSPTRGSGPSCSFAKSNMPWTNPRMRSENVVVRHWKINNDFNKLIDNPISLRFDRALSFRPFENIILPSYWSRSAPRMPAWWRARTVFDRISAVAMNSVTCFTFTRTDDFIFPQAPVVERELSGKTERKNISYKHFWATSIVIASHYDITTYTRCTLIITSYNYFSFRYSCCDL